MGPLLRASLESAPVVDFGGYSYFRASVTETALCAVPPCPTSVTSHPNLNGWDAGVEYKAFKEVGLVADFGDCVIPSAARDPGLISALCSSMGRPRVQLTHFPFSTFYFPAPAPSGPGLFCHNPTDLGEV